MECAGTTSYSFYLCHQALQVEVFIGSHHRQQIIVYFMTFLIHTCALLVYRSSSVYLGMHLSSNRKMHSELLTMTLYDLLQFRYNCIAMSTIQRLANSLGGGSAKRKISS